MTDDATLTTRRQDLDRLLRQHRPMVRRMAQRLVSRLPANVEFDDLLQAGMIGLAEVLSRSELTEGPQFEAYATPRIHGAMLDELRAADWASRDVRRRQRDAGVAVQRLEQRLGRAPQPSEIARELEITLDEYETLRTSVHESQFVSLDEVAGDDDEGSTLERHVADAQADPVHHVGERRRRQALVRAIEALPERERQALSLYHEQDLSLREIGEVLGVSESRVCHLHAQAVRRLRIKLRDW